MSSLEVPRCRVRQRGSRRRLPKVLPLPSFGTHRQVANCGTSDTHCPLTLTHPKADNSLSLSGSVLSIFISPASALHYTTLHHPHHHRRHEDHIQGNAPLCCSHSSGADRVQDLKQNKFVIEAEPSETVRRAATLLRCIVLTLTSDWRTQGQDPEQ